MSATIQPAGTGSMTVASGRAAINPIAYGYYPAEGSRAVSAIYDWTNQSGYAEDLTQLVARGVETTIQSIFVDNTSCTADVTVLISGTGQVIQCGALGQGIFPAFFSGAPGFQIGVASAGILIGATRLILLNVPAGSGMWGPSTVTVQGVTGNIAVPVFPQAFPLTNAVAGTMGLAPAIIVPASAARKWLNITNRSTGAEVQDIGPANVAVGSGIPLYSGAGFLFNGAGATGPFYGVTTIASSPFSYVEG
jgi:hypothetical protein